MLDQLVESKDTFKGMRMLLLLVLLVTVVAATSTFGKFLWDLREHFIKSERVFADLKLDEVESPVPVADDEPPPEPEKVIQKVEKVQQNVDVRKELMLDVAQSFKVPDKPSAEQNKTVLTRDLDNTIKGNDNITAKNLRKDPNEAISLNKDGVSNDDPNKTFQEKDDDEPKIIKPTPTPKKEEPTPKPVPKTVSGGVVNGKATRLVTPQYPSQARAVRASGQVSVAVTIDENGNVISASAVSGHTLLRGAAESAARSSKFAPTTLSGQPVKVTGTIIYNFVP